jgi:hypothetical protein
MAPFRGARELLVTIPGISTGVADVIIAETGGDMSRFPSADHLASWAGTCPGSNESAGKVKSTHTRPGNPYLKGALGVAAMSVTKLSGMVKFSACMRSHGVPNWPDPTTDSDGRPLFPLSSHGITRIQSRSQQMMTKEGECQHLIPAALGGIPIG